MPGKAAAQIAISSPCRGGCFSPPPPPPPPTRQTPPADNQIHEVAQLKNSSQETKLLKPAVKISPSPKINSTKHPQSLFRLERTPTDCFQQLTRILIEPMFRLEMKNLVQSNSGATTIQSQQTSNRRQFLIRSPRRTHHPTHPRNPSPNPRSSRPKFFPEGILKIAFADTDHRQIATLASFCENFTEKLAFGGVQQRMCSEDFRQRGKRTARS